MRQFLTVLLILTAVPATAQVVKITTPETAPPKGEIFGARLGYSVSLSGDLMLIGAPWFKIESLPGGNHGAAFVYRREGEAWVREARLTASDANSAGQLGWSVALDGERALINARGGAPGLPDGASALYVFERDGSGTWTETAKITVPDPGEDEFLVGPVALSGDHAIAGAIGSSGGPAAAYFFGRTATGEWVEEARIPRPAPADFFAHTVALSGDLALVGAYEENYGGMIDAGALYVYRRTETAGQAAWAFEARLVASDAEEGDGFGFGLALVGSSTDGAAAVVGAGASARTGDFLGAAYVLRRAPGPGGAWAEEARLVGSGPVPMDWFGRSAGYVGSLAGAAGDLAVVGAFRNPAEGDLQSWGAVYSFVRDADGAWREVAKLRPTGEPEYEEFGRSVSAQEGPGGPEVAVGAPQDTEEGTSAGAAYWFGSAAVVRVEPTVPPSEGLRLYVYPNPARGAAAVRVEGGAQTTEVRLVLYDGLGRRVASLWEGVLGAGAAHEVHFDAGSWPSGTYLVRLESASGEAFTRSVVVLK